MLNHCPSCGKDVLFISEKQYEGFSVVGEIHRCTQCGFEQGASEAPVREKADPLAGLFSKDDLPETPRVFDGTENSRFCRYCHHYVVNPFRQRCMLLEKDVGATDTCDRFKKAESS